MSAQEERARTLGNTAQMAAARVTCPYCGHVTRYPRWSSLTLTAYCAGAHCHRKIHLVDLATGQFFGAKP